jgi:hypothetical protein
MDMGEHVLPFLGPLPTTFSCACHNPESPPDSTLRGKQLNAGFPQFNLRAGSIRKF